MNSSGKVGKGFGKGEALREREEREEREASNLVPTNESARHVALLAPGGHHNLQENRDNKDSIRVTTIGRYCGNVIKVKVIN